MRKERKNKDMEETRAERRGKVGNKRRKKIPLKLT